jgi:hypothetical protein
MVFSRYCLDGIGKIIRGSSEPAGTSHLVYLLALEGCPETVGGGNEKEFVRNVH